MRFRSCPPEVIDAILHATHATLLALSRQDATQQRERQTDEKLSEALMAPRQAEDAALRLAPRNAHNVFIALRPDGMAGPPYEVQAQRQWMAQYRAYWEQCTVTAEEQTTFVQYGLASPLRDRQAARVPQESTRLRECCRARRDTHHNGAAHLARCGRHIGDVFAP